MFGRCMISIRTNDVRPNVLGKLRQRKRLFIAGQCGPRALHSHSAAERQRGRDHPVRRRVLAVTAAAAAAAASAAAAARGPTAAVELGHHCAERLVAVT